MTRFIIIATMLLAFSVAAGSHDYGQASWYGEEHRGKPMANGYPFNPDAMTCASWHYPFGTLLYVSTASKHRVRRGETFSHIARRNGVTTAEILNLNPGVNPRRLQVGQLVNVPSDIPQRAVVVRVTDRGPNRRFKSRVIDLSRAAFAKLADPRLGLVVVRVQRVGDNALASR